MPLFSDKEEYLNGFAKTKQGLKRLVEIDGETQASNISEDLMITLIESDMGYHTSEKVCKLFLEKAGDSFLDKTQIVYLLKQSMQEIYEAVQDQPIVYSETGPTVYLLVGVNGSGKTTTCAKLAANFQNEGKKILMAAGDTFRAGAVEQLQKWGDRLFVDVVAGKFQQDPSSVLVDACIKAREENYDVLICDTAGRLQNKKNLMAELEKMHRVIDKQIPGAPHNTWLVLDANTGQNGLSQAELFKESTDLTGIILTKIDGTAKGGIVLAIKDKLGIPLRYLGLGEKETDLREFNLDLYLYSILEGLLDEN